MSEYRRLINGWITAIEKRRNTARRMEIIHEKMES
jgi:hypothetical protein